MQSDSTLLQGTISQDEGLREVLEMIPTIQNVQFALLEVRSDELQGKVGFFCSKIITGAMTSDGLTREPALRKLLALTGGRFRLRSVQGHEMQDLRQSMAIDLVQLLEMPDVANPYQRLLEETQDQEFLSELAGTIEMERARAEEARRAQEEQAAAARHQQAAQARASAKQPPVQAKSVEDKAHEVLAAFHAQFDTGTQQIENRRGTIPELRGSFSRADETVVLGMPVSDIPSSSELLNDIKFDASQVAIDTALQSKGLQEILAAHLSTQSQQSAASKAPQAPAVLENKVTQRLLILIIIFLLACLATFVMGSFVIEFFWRR